MRVRVTDSVSREMFVMRVTDSVSREMFVMRVRVTDSRCASQMFVVRVRVTDSGCISREMFLMAVNVTCVLYRGYELWQHLP